MQKNSRSIRIAVALGAAGTALATSTLLGGAANAGYNCYPKSSVIARSYDPCYTPATRPEETTTTTEAVTTTTAAVTTTTEGERPTTSTTMGTTTPTTAAPTTTAPTVGGATGARPVAAQASYTG